MKRNLTPHKFAQGDSSVELEASEINDDQDYPVRGSPFSPQDSGHQQPKYVITDQRVESNMSREADVSPTSSNSSPRCIRPLPPPPLIGCLRKSPTDRTTQKRKVRIEPVTDVLVACKAGELFDVIRHLDLGMDVNTCNAEGMTALHYACICSQLDVIEKLIAYGADINRRDHDGWTPLHLATHMGQMSTARFLVHNGASIICMDNENRLAIDLSLIHFHYDITEFLYKEMTERQIDVFQLRQAEEEALVADALRWLSDERMDMVVKCHPITGAIGMHVAASKGYIKALMILVTRPEYVNVQDNHGWTPLHAASFRGQQEAAKILVEACADMTIVDKNGDTCFDVASSDAMRKHLKQLQAFHGTPDEPQQLEKLDDLEAVGDQPPRPKNPNDRLPGRMPGMPANKYEEPWRWKLLQRENEFDGENNASFDLEQNFSVALPQGDSKRRYVNPYKDEVGFRRRYDALMGRLKNHGEIRVKGDGSYETAFPIDVERQTEDDSEVEEIPRESSPEAVNSSVGRYVYWTVFQSAISENIEGQSTASYGMQFHTSEVVSYGMVFADNELTDSSSNNFFTETEDSISGGDEQPFVPTECCERDSMSKITKAVSSAVAIRYNVGTYIDILAKIIDFHIQCENQISKADVIASEPSGGGESKKNENETDYKTLYHIKAEEVQALRKELIEVNAELEGMREFIAKNIEGLNKMHLLEAENQLLIEQNGSLVRVISQLSKVADSN